MYFVGVDLTSAFSSAPRAIDVALLDSTLACRFLQVQWPRPSEVSGRNSALLRTMIASRVQGDQIWAIDGPQGLASPGMRLRHCERLLGTPGKTPDTLPPATSSGAPFGDYIRSSVDLFAALLANVPPPRLAGYDGTGLAEATLYEVFPGSEWTVLAGRRLRNKETKAGRLERRSLLAALGLCGLPAVPTADENDAAVAAYLAWRTRFQEEGVTLVGHQPRAMAGELREGYILHATEGGLAFEELAETQADADHAGSPLPVEGDWSSREAIVLKLTDYGLVHGSCLENQWMRPGEDYSCRSLAPDVALSFKLVHAKTFSGGRGWRAEPSVKNLLTALGYATPPTLGEANAVVLRISMIS